MDRNDSSRPDGRQDSSDAIQEAKRNENPIKRRKGFVACENDQIATQEYIEQFFESDAGKRLCAAIKRYISGKLWNKSRVDDVYQDVLLATVKNVKKGKIYESGLRPYMF